MKHKLILKGGYVIDPSQAHEGVADVAFGDGRVSGFGENIAADRSTRVIELNGSIVTPGLIDLHTHVYWGGTSLGVDADALGRRTGVTTFVDTGSAGPGNFSGFRKHVIEKSRSRILAFLHISFAGIFGFSERLSVGESEDSRLLSPVDAVEVIEANKDCIIGIKVRVGKHTSGTLGLIPLEIALQVAEQTGLPVMVHIDEPPPTYEAVVSLLRHGDILTHAFRPFPNSPLGAQGKIKSAIVDARERGVLFDIGHGKGSFSFQTARAMLANGFPPDTISSDVHKYCIAGPAFDQLITMSKFLVLGMKLGDVIAASTANPAMAIRRPELGSLKVGSTADATILALKKGDFQYQDAKGETLIGDVQLACEGLVLNGAWSESWQG
ncbi:MAG: amidohydrolase/deacetylase family metallohydrolase [Nitratireductor sp.]|nr:amidohydrolase/deacetylase family metallohydrolase [Nitratireductor sp.]